MVSPRQLSLLDALVDTGTVSGAAERENITQPAVSKALAALEQQVGFDVFERRNRRLVLTNKGLSLHAEAQRLLSRIDEFNGVVEDIRNRGAQRIRVATTAVIASSRFFAAALAEFVGNNPNVHMEIETMPRPEITRATLREHADVVVSFLPFTNPDIETSRIGSCGIVAIAKKNTWLSDGEVVTPLRLSELPVIFLFERSRLRKTLDQFMYRSGYSLEVRAEVSNSLVALELAAAGGGVAVCDDINLNALPRRKFDVCRFSEPMQLEIGILRRRGHKVSDYQAQIGVLLKESYQGLHGGIAPSPRGSGR